MMNQNLKWFAVRVRSRCEKLTSTDLANRGYEVCSACAPQRRVWADRVRTVEMPMFPGYIFARFDPSRALEVLTAAGVVSIVGFGVRYCPVNEIEIEALRVVMRSGVEVLRELLVQPGAQVRVSNGPLRGLEGVLMQVKNQHRLVVSVSLLQRSVSVEIDDLMIEAMSPRPASKSGAAA
jgi:transcription antitermination factor NusG